MAGGRRIILGLNSGTSADGVDAVACEITGVGVGMRVRVLGHVRRKYPADLRRRLLAVMAPASTRTEDLCLLSTEVGEAFARAARACVKKLGLRRIAFAGAHGQTVCHLPPGGDLHRSESSASSRSSGDRRRGRRVFGTMQIGDAAIIATALGVPVVSGFRQADMAIGGQGAPLVPWTDYVLFHHPRRSLAVQNIGGIANMTWLPAGGALDEVIAFDTGPGNMVIDAMVRHFTKGREQYDRGGRRAARGKVDERVLKRLLDHRFLTTPPPKSCGREVFGEKWVRDVLRRYSSRKSASDDWIATATAFTAASIAMSYALFISPHCRRYPPVDEVILCGGGAKNPSLVRDLLAYVSLDGACEGVAVSTTADYGITPQAKEGVSFAMLAAACVDGVAANLPRVTGARRRVVLGQIASPEPRR
ncbi:MAG: anhydro-N-acetylmuramic acid kinase [Planctomycetota bacterium]